MPTGNPLSFPDVCQYVGQLFLETRHELERLASQAKAREDELSARLAKAERERDDALRLAHGKE